MSDVFLKVLNMGIAAGWLVLAVVALRLLLKKAPKWIACALWVVVAIRLICPFSFESALSLIPSAETVSPEILYAQEPVIQSGVPVINSALNPVISSSFAPSPGAGVNPLQIWTAIAAYVWLAGVAAMLICAAVSFLRLRRKVGASLNVRDNVWICDDINTPFVLGVIKPRIYLPSCMEDPQQVQVIAHENAHLRRRDHWWKPLGFLLLAVYWFNPLCWLAYILLCRDIELACDERVIRTMEKDGMIAYSEALLACSVPRRQISACPLAFGEVGVKERVKTVLNYKKPAFWIIVVALLACIVVAVCFLTNPKTAEKIKWAERPTLVVDGVSYIDPYMPVSEPPYGYTLAGTLSEEQANDTGLAGCKYYTHPDDADSFFVFEECGTPIDENTVDSEKLQWAYVRWVREGSKESNARLLTLDDVRFLAKKGSELTWSNFDKYSHIETGSGLYIRVYEIDGLFSLWIGGSSAEGSPMYIRLASKANQDDYIDIRTEDVEAFIAEHSSTVPAVGGAELTSAAYQTAYSWANYSEDGYNAMVKRAENRDTKRRYGNIEHLTPVVKLDSKAELDGFYKEMSPYFDLTRSYDEVDAFSAQMEQYTEEFFAEQSLFIAYLEESTSSNRHKVEEVRIENGILEIRICQLTPFAFDTAMAGWFISVAIPKADIASCTGYDAYICATYDPDGKVPSGNLIRKYTHEGENITRVASVSLYDSGEFIFNFSPISSSIGYGTYTMENGRLTLNTADGEDTYVFDMVNDTLVFDGPASSIITWYSGVTNGAVFG